MAKRGAKTSNKSAAIREFMASNPEAGPTEIARALNEREGWKISAAYVSTIKSKSGSKPSGGRRRGRRRAQAAAGVAVGVNEQALMQAKKMAEQIGGIEEARAALDLLSRLTK